MTNTVTRLSAIVLATLLAATTFSLYVFEASANQNHHRGGGGDKTEIELENKDTKVVNNVSVTANTGGNNADGGDSGDRNRRGPISLRFPGGHGSHAGPGGDGGTITTGAATAIGTVHNDVNNNRVIVEGCGCDDDGPMDRFSRFFRFDKNGKVLEIESENKGTTVRSTLDVKANTGRNSVEGGDSRGGGSPIFNPWSLWFGHHGDHGGGDGGTIRTGTAHADGLVTNIVNRNVVRVENGDDDDEEDENPV